MKALSIMLVFVLIFSFSIKTEALSASAAVLIGADTGEVILSKNKDLRLPMASTTKIMTAYILCETADLDKKIVTTKEMVTVEGSSMGLLEGDTVSYRDLLYGMMLSSGNDAANTVAISLAGSIEGFVALMNQKAKQLGLDNTHFETPSGLDGNNHYTTAYDLALLTKYALKNEDFAAAVSSKTATLCYGNPPYNRTLTNHNRLLKFYDDVIGVKTGFTKKAGRCLVSAARKNGKTVIAVTLDAPNDWEDHRYLLDMGLEAVKTVELTPKLTQFKIPVLGSDENIDIEIEPYKISVVNTDALRVKVDMDSMLFAPVKKGEKIGKIDYYLGATLLSSEDVLSPKSIGQTKRKDIFGIFELLRLMLKGL